MQEDQALQLKYKSTPITEFWKFVPESKNPEFKKAPCRIISIFKMGIMLFHFKICKTQTPISINYPASERITEKYCYQLFTKC